MTDPALAALTEALHSVITDGYRKVYLDPADPDRWYADFAAAILAHPAMADLARKAAAWDEYQAELERDEAAALGEQPDRSQS